MWRGGLPGRLGASAGGRHGRDAGETGEDFAEAGGEGVAGGVGGGEEFGNELAAGEGEEGGVGGGFGVAGAGLGFEAVGAAAFEGEGLGAVFFAAKAGEFGKEFAEALPAVLGLGGGGEEVRGGEGEVGAEEAGEGVGRGGGAVGRGELGGGVGEVEEAVAFILAFLPVGEAALSPVGKVGFVDGLGIEVVGEDGLDFGERVEPGQEGLGLMAVIQAAVELVADLAREPGDLAFAGVTHGGSLAWERGEVCTRECTIVYETVRICTIFDF